MHLLKINRNYGLQLLLALFLPCNKKENEKKKERSTLSLHRPDQQT